MHKILRYLEPPKEVSRRDFLRIVSLGTAGFVVGCSTTPPPSPTTPSPQATAATPEPTSALQSLNSFVKIGSDDRVTVVIKHAEFGQGVTTGLTTIVAEELDADWEQMSWEFAPADVTQYANLGFKIQGTGGSSSISNSWEQLRKAGAAARAMLVAAAATAWGVKAEEIVVEAGELSHPSGKKSRFGPMAEAASKVEPPAEPKLKDPKDFKLIGKGVKRLDVGEKSSGQAQFTIDVEKPGMVVAVVAHPPQFGATVKSFKADEALKTPGVLEVVQIPRGVAVVAKDFWAAKKGREALVVEWDDSKAEKRGSEELMADFRKQAETAGAVARDDGDAAKALGEAAKKIETEYEFPFLAHAPLEPLGCVVELKDDGCHITHGAQLHTLDQQNVAAALGIELTKVTIESVFGGGSFGRRAAPDSDYVVECATIAKAMKKKAPVKLIWDRTDNLRGGRYRPMSFHKVAGAIDKDGNISAYQHRVVIQSFFHGTPFAAMIQNGVDPSAVEGSNNLPYAIPNQKVDAHMAEVGIPTLWWRSVGHTHNAFVTETFFDRLCVEAKKDPIKTRQELLKEHPRHLAAFNLAVEKAGPAPTGEGVGRGVAVHKSFHSYVAQVVDIHMEKGKVKVDRVVCAVDCGIAVNPDIVKAQMESGIVYGLSAALAEQITLKEGKVQQANFDSYQIARMRQAPQSIEVHIVPSGEAPTGVGEPGLPPLAPALANAIYQATGKWITKLPLRLERLV